MIWIQLDGEVEDATDWKKRLIREGFEPSDRSRADAPAHARASWRYTRPSTGGVVRVAVIRPVQGEARSICTFLPGPRESIADAPTFFRGRRANAHCSDCGPDLEARDLEAATRVVRGTVDPAAAAVQQATGDAAADPAAVSGADPASDDPTVTTADPNHPAHRSPDGSLEE